MTPAEVLSKARDVLAERGHCKFTFEDRVSGAVCAWGAINVAATGEAVPLDKSDSGRAAADAYLCLSRYTMLTFGRGAFYWNDEPDTTCEDVMLALKHAEAMAQELPSG